MGMFALAVMTPLEWSHAQALGIASLVRGYFSSGTPLTYDGVSVVIRQAPYAGTAYRDGPYNRLPVNIKWSCIG